jgi:hypothetical protein
LIDSKLAELIHAHPLIIIGSCDRGLVPAATRGFGARVLRQGSSMDVLVTRWPSLQTIDNIEQTRRIAVTFTNPEDFVSYQFKGRVTSCTVPDEDDKRLSANYCEAIGQRLAAIGLPAGIAGLVFLGQDVTRVNLEITEAYHQTPGRNAGTRL